MGASFEQQSDRLSSAGYPKPVLVSVVERILREARPSAQHRSEDVASGNCPKVGVVPYMHQISHNLKKIGKKANIKVVFLAPNKLGKPSKLTNPNRPTPEKCNKKHQKRFVACASWVVYSLPLNCKRQYIGQTGRCLNDRLRKHCNNIKSGTGGFLAAH